MSDDAFAETIVGVETSQVDQGGVLAGYERCNAVKEEMLKPWSPAVAPYMLERRYDAGRGKRAALWSDFSRRIEADWIFRLGGVEVAHVVDARARDGVENIGREIAVWIDDDGTFARENVGHGEIEQQRALARTALPHQPDMALPFLAREHDGGAVFGVCNYRKLCLHTVAPVPGDDALCQCSSRLPSCALPYSWRSGERGTPSDPW